MFYAKNIFKGWTTFNKTIFMKNKRVWTREGGWKLKFIFCFVETAHELFHLQFLTIAPLQMLHNTAVKASLNNVTTSHCNLTEKNHSVPNQPVKPLSQSVHQRRLVWGEVFFGLSHDAAVTDRSAPRVLCVYTFVMWSSFRWGNDSTTSLQKITVSRKWKVHDSWNLQYTYVI
jgi:hypothetical protein